MTLVTTVLRLVSVSRPRTENVAGAYAHPTRKTRDSPNFCTVGIFKVNTIGMGRTKRATSVTVLVTAVAIYNPF